MDETAVESEVESEEIEHDQYLIFTIEDQTYGIQAMKVREIDRMANITRIPNSPDYVEGVMNLRGHLTSVINFRKRFGFPPREHAEDTRIVVVEREDQSMGIIADSVQEVMKVPDNLVQAVPESARNTTVEEFITGVGIVEGKLTILLDVDQVLSKSDVRDAANLRSALEGIHDAARQLDPNLMGGESKQTLKEKPGPVAETKPESPRRKKSARKTKE